MNYSNTYLLAKYDTILSIVHLIVPFIINLGSAIAIIIKITRMKQVTATVNQKSMWKRKIRKHRHILISPCLLILFASPRLIASFLYACGNHRYGENGLKSTLLYLSAYFISLIPHASMLFIFVLPVRTYRKALGDASKRYRSLFFKSFNF